MVPQTQSAKTPMAGPPTTVVRKPLANTLVTTRHRADPRVAAAPPCHLRGTSMILVCLIRPRNFVAGSTQMRHIADTNNAFSATTSVPSVPFPDTIPPHAVVHTETKPVHHVSPHAQPPILMPCQTGPARILPRPRPNPEEARLRGVYNVSDMDRIQRRHKYTGISYENVNRVPAP